MSDLSPFHFKEQLLLALPEDGGELSDAQAMITMVDRLGRQVSSDEYYEARAELEALKLVNARLHDGEELIRRAVKPKPVRRPLPPSVDWNREQDLRRPFEAFLRLRLGHAFNLPLKDARPLIERIGEEFSHGNTVSGENLPAQLPDLVMLERCPPGSESGNAFHVYSFKIKTETGCDDKNCAMEVLNHGRFVHYPYLVWHLPADSSRRGADYAQMRSKCRQIGIGLIVFSDPLDPASYMMDVMALPQEPRYLMVEEFVQSQLGQHAQQALTDHLVLS